MTSESFRTNPMFLRNQFKGDGVFEIPKIEKEEIELENIELIGYDKLNEKGTDKIVHFFLDDYKFEVMWNDPEPRIERLKKYKAVLAPNYSIYTEMPLSLKVYNTFKSRWCGAYLQSKGIKVIPTVAWGEPNTFWFCFDGIEQGSIVAVSTLGVRKEKALFMQGYNELIRKVKPKAVICYGEPFEEMQGKIITVDYATTNNLSSKDYETLPGFIRKTYIFDNTNYIETDKGMGSAGGGDKPTWTPKKPADERFIGKPGEIKETIHKNGEKYLTKIGQNGFAEKERHCGDHGYPNKHSSPHDHTIDWSNNYPDPSSPINYDGEIPEFKQYGDMKMKNANIIEFSPFESIEEFKFSLMHGREIEFTWKEKSYGIFKENDSGTKMFFICEAYKDERGTYFATIDELLNFKIQEQHLREIITKVQVDFRFL